MSNLSSHQKYTLYKHCLSLGIPDDIAVKIREQADSTLESIMTTRLYDSEIEDLIKGAFYWNLSNEGADYWAVTVKNLLNKGELR